MPAFEYANSPFPIRSDLREAHRRTWDAIAEPGDWWTGAERIALAEEVRAAATCPLCIERKTALSPYSVSGSHARACETTSPIEEAAVDAVHRIVTDATRLTRAYLEKLSTEGITDGHYVELLGLVVAVYSIDRFHLALGLPLEALPRPRPGAPARVRPGSAIPDVGWVPMIPNGRATGSEADLYATHAPNVLRALSLVPDAVRRMKDLSAAQYVPIEQVADPMADPGRKLSRAQIELVASRVSAVNECFY
jgi:hypothetical protein